MPSFVECTTFAKTKGSSHAIHALNENLPDRDLIADHLAKQGFRDFEYLGAGSHAMVIAPTDNPDIVLRITHYGADNRFRLPQMLQTLATERLATTEEDGKIYGGYTLEVLKRLDMEVNRQETLAFISEAEACGCRIHSFGNWAEVGRYNFTGKEGEAASVLMATDPSALSPGRPLGERGCTAGYPTLKDQIEENIRIARADPRLAGYLPDLEKSLETAPHTPMLEGPALPSRLKPTQMTR